MNVGWKCPVCGAGIAPTVTRCDHGGSAGFVGSPTVIPPVLPNGSYRCYGCGADVTGVHQCSFPNRTGDVVTINFSSEVAI